ncbi:MAG: hypothetical protein Q8R16_00720 [bacterium]|nr:hypothetical protein [bacterium]
MSEKRNEQLNTYALCPLGILLMLLTGTVMWRFGDWADSWTALQLFLFELGALYVCYAFILRMRLGLRVISKLHPSTSRSEGAP